MVKVSDIKINKANPRQIKDELKLDNGLQILKNGSKVKHAVIPRFAATRC